MTVSLRLNKEEERLIKKYAELKQVSLSELFRTALIEKIEDEYDLQCYEKAIKEYNDDPKTYTLEEVEKELGLNWNTKLNFLKEQKNN